MDIIHELEYEVDDILKSLERDLILSLIKIIAFLSLIIAAIEFFKN